MVKEKLPKVLKTLPKSAPRAAKRYRSIDETRALLVRAAGDIVDAAGFGEVTARKVGEVAGCPAGLIYYAFEELDSLMLALNMATAQNLDAALAKAMTPDQGRAALDRMAIAYLDFAITHTQRWRALFEYRLRKGAETPAPFRDAILAMFRRLTIPLGALRPASDPADIEIMARTLFSAVHGIVAMGLEANMVAVPSTRLRDQVLGFVETYAKGLDAASAANGATVVGEVGLEPTKA